MTARHEKNDHVGAGRRHARRPAARPALAGALGLAVLVSGVGIAHADTLSDLTNRLSHARQQAKSTKADLADVADDLEDTDAQLAKAYTRLKKTQAKIPVAQAKVDKADAAYQASQREASAVADRLTTARTEASTLQKTIAQNQKKTTEARDGVAEMARQFAKGDYGFTGVELMVGAQSLEDVVTEYNLSQTALRTESGTLQELREANAIATNTQVRLDAVETSISQLKTKADALVSSTAQKKKAAEAAQTRLTDLESQQSSAAATIASRRDAEKKRQRKLKNQRETITSKVQKLIGMTKKERARLARERAKREREAREQAKRDAATSSSSSSGGSSSSSSSSSSGSAPTSRSDFFAYPLHIATYVTSPFGYRFHPVLHTWRLHSGTDLHAPCGTPVYASAPGTVTWAKYYYGYGNQVLLDNGTYQGDHYSTTYDHLSVFKVHAGEHVSRGQLLAYSGATGTVTACHLHFEILRNGEFINPMTML